MIFSKISEHYELFGKWWIDDMGDDDLGYWFKTERQAIDFVRDFIDNNYLV